MNKSTQRFSSTKALRWAVVIPAMCLPLLGSVFYFVIFSGEAIGRAFYMTTKVFTVIFPVIAFLFILKERHRFSPKLSENRKLHLKSLPLGILVGLGIVGVMVLLMLTPVWESVQAGGPAIREKVAGLGILEHYILFALFVSFIHSFIEEYYWRWFVYGQLRELVKPWVAHLLAALSFSAHHIVVTTQFFSPVLGVVFGLLVGGGGLFWSLLYERQKTLAGAWVSHMLADIGLLSIGYYLAGIHH